MLQVIAQNQIVNRQAKRFKTGEPILSDKISNGRLNSIVNDENMHVVKT